MKKIFIKRDIPLQDTNVLC